MSDIALRGYIWKDGFCLDPIPESLISCDCSPQHFFDTLKTLDGCFSIVLQRGDYLLATVDRIRSLPLFYTLHNGELIIGSNAFELRSRLGDPPLDQSALLEFLMTGYTSGNDTLFQEIKQLEAGQCLIWNKSTQTLQIRDYYRYQHLYEPIGDPLQEMDRMHERIITKLIASARGRTLVIPLSGGYDSRLIATMLKRLGYPKVICFTYGSARNGECVTSRKVAKFLGLPWLIIEHNRREWYEAFHSDAMRAYFRYSTHLCSSPHIQDWLAVQQLKERDLIPEDSLIVPGHSGGSPQGANLPRIFEDKDDITTQDLLNTIYHKHFDLWKSSRDQFNSHFAQRITDYLQIPASLASESAASLFDEWDWRQRQSKFITNSIRVYDFFGYDWRLPLWDLEFMEFWRRVPLAGRMHRSLYRQYAKKYQPIPLPVYHDLPWSQRLANKPVRMSFGNIMDPRYGRFLDYRNKHEYSNTRVASLCAPNICYPDFVNQELPVLRADVNALQALTYLKELVTGRLDS